MLPARILDSGTGTPVLFVHAFPFNADMWGPQFEELTGAMRCIAFDLPGVAEGGPARDDLDMTLAADMCVAVLDHLGIDRAVIAGCSMGGYIAMAALARHAARFSAAVFMDTRAGADSDEGRRNRTLQREEVLAYGTAGLIDGMLPKLLAEASVARQPELAVRVRAMMEAATPAGVAAMLVAMRDRADSSDMLRALELPVCVIVGEHDLLTPVAEAETIARLAGRSELHVVASAGHLANLEAPDACNAIIREFVARVA